jgi:hypothetical protein
MESQNIQILTHLRNIGPITAIEALEEYGCFRLAARIKNLRDTGYDITTTRIQTNSGKIIALYALTGEKK